MLLDGCDGESFDLLGLLMIHGFQFVPHLSNFPRVGSSGSSDSGHVNGLPSSRIHLQTLEKDMLE